jgi:hypothetical protein
MDKYKKYFGDKLVYFSHWGCLSGEWVAVTRQARNNNTYYSVYRGIYGSCDVLGCSDCDPYRLIEKLVECSTCKTSVDDLMAALMKPYITIHADIMLDLIAKDELHTLFPANLKYKRNDYTDGKYFDEVDYAKLVADLKKVLQNSHPDNKNITF